MAKRTAKTTTTGAKTAAKAAAKAIGKATGKATDKAAAKAAEKATEQAADRSTEQAGAPGTAADAAEARAAEARAAGAGAEAVDNRRQRSRHRGRVVPTGEPNPTTESAQPTTPATPTATPTATAIATADAGTGAAAAEGRLLVRKTYKLYIGGKFPRSESGRSLPVAGADGTLLANASRASRKDVRDAVVAARKGFAAWSGATAYNRGQVLYRAAEMLEGRAEQLAAEVAAAEGLPAADAAASVAKAVDRLVWYAGWTDKLAQVFGAPNPVAGPFLNVSEPDPTGIVGLIAPLDSSLLGLVSRLAPILAGGNSAVVVASEPHPLPAVTFAEVLATSDLPAGAVNVLTGLVAELAPVLAAHMDVNGLDLAGLDPSLRRDLEVAAAENVKRVVGPLPLRGADWLDDTRAQDPYWVAAFLETKTVWHPAGV